MQTETHMADAKTQAHTAFLFMSLHCFKQRPNVISTIISILVATERLPLSRADCCYEAHSSVKPSQAEEGGRWRERLRVQHMGHVVGVEHSFQLSQFYKHAGKKNE